jgi:hypothetical protein
VSSSAAASRTPQVIGNAAKKMEWVSLSSVCCACCRSLIKFLDLLVHDLWKMRGEIIYLTLSFVSFVYLSPSPFYPVLLSHLFNCCYYCSSPPSFFLLLLIKIVPSKEKQTP